MIVLRFNRPLDHESFARLQAHLDEAVQKNRIIVVDNSVEVFTDEADLIRLDPQCECGKS